MHAPRSSTGDVVTSDTMTLNAAGSALDDLDVAMANASDLYDKFAASANNVGTPAPSDFHGTPHCERPQNANKYSDS